MRRYAIVMAGGSGTRFWPLSRRERPKQILRLLSEKTLLEETVARIHPMFPMDRIVVVCNRSYSAIVRQILPELPPENIIGEPVGRNTAPCIALVAAWLANRDPDSSMCVLPADHFIQDTQRFVKLLKAALTAAETTELLITFGIIPTQPHTGYGYIRAGEVVAIVDELPVLRGEQFVEKPNRTTAEEYLAEGNYYWNSGMFAWKTQVILEEMNCLQPEIVQPLTNFFRSGQNLTDQDSFGAVFSRLPSISIDYGLMEKSRRVALVRGDFGWNDVGSWDALGEIMPAPGGNVVVGNDHVLVDSKRCIVVGPDTLITCLGVEDLVVVATPDAVLVTKKDRAQDVRLVVEKLKEMDAGKYL